jgi:hypothetical protein
VQIRNVRGLDKVTCISTDDEVGQMPRGGDDGPVSWSEKKSRCCPCKLHSLSADAARSRGEYRQKIEEGELIRLHINCDLFNRLPRYYRKIKTPIVQPILKLCTAGCKGFISCPARPYPAPSGMMQTYRNSTCGCGYLSMACLAARILKWVCARGHARPHSLT